MSKGARDFVASQTRLVTVITAERRPKLLCHAGLLVRAVLNAQRRTPFAMLAWVILPDHFHAIIETPTGDIAGIIKRVKQSFTIQLRRKSGETGPVWRPGFQDYVIRSDDDLYRHLDSVHYDPVKHGLTDAPKGWLLSSFLRYVGKGHYDLDWGPPRPTSRITVIGE